MPEAGMINRRYELNQMAPAAHDASLGDCLYDLLNAYNDLAGKYNALLAHLDTANVAGIGNANAATFGESAYPSLLLPEQRTPGGG
jgi:hypothetical protein